MSARRIDDNEKRELQIQGKTLYYMSMIEEDTKRMCEIAEFCRERLGCQIIGQEICSQLTTQVIGMSQETLCENICSVQTLSRIENGKVNVKRDIYSMLMERMGRSEGEDSQRVKDGGF